MSIYSGPNGNFIYRFWVFFCFCQVEGLDEDNSRVILKLSLSSETVTISQFAVELVSKKDFDKYSKYLSKSLILSHDVGIPVPLCGYGSHFLSIFLALS